MKLKKINERQRKDLKKTRYTKLLLKNSEGIGKEQNIPSQISNYY